MVATEQTEPQAVIGSTLQKIAYPSNYQRFIKVGRSWPKPTNTKAIRGR